MADQFVATVIGVRHIGTRVRLTARADGLDTYVPSGPDEYAGVIFPAPDKPLVMPDPSVSNLRAAVTAIAAEERPNLRWYTIRAHRPALSEVDIDVVLHGNTGPGSAWASRVTVGDVFGFRPTGSCWAGQAARSPLLVADESALPALEAIFEAHAHNWQAVEAHIEVESAADVPELPPGVTVHVRGDRPPGDTLRDALAETVAGASDNHDHVWISGESGMVTGLRRQLVRSGMDAKAITFIGYWKQGQART